MSADYFVYEIAYVDGLPFPFRGITTRMSNINQLNYAEFVMQREKFKSVVSAVTGSRNITVLYVDECPDSYFRIAMNEDGTPSRIVEVIVDNPVKYYH